MQNLPAYEKVLLVTLQLPHEDEREVEESLEELARLADTAGAQVVGRVVQRARRPDPATFLGRGKVREEIAPACRELGVDLVICDHELSPAQVRNLEEELGVRVIDRTQLILDIFARRARTREGRLQVELAQLEYLYPRLTGRGTELSRLGGGIGTRGPGETKLETDRRRIKRRITDLRRELEEVRRHRALLRARRQGVPLTLVSLVGYTNAGKSTLLNALTGAGVPAEDKLFATLDPTTRRLVLPNNEMVLLTDTVGFIRRLPHHLVAAFRATLEEVVEADLLLHVVDVSSPDYPDQVKAVEKVLASLGAGEKPTILVYNKIDRLTAEETWLLPTGRPAVAVSALTGRGLDELRRLIMEVLRDQRVRREFLVPYRRGDVLNLLYEKGEVLRREDTPAGVLLEVELGAVWASRAAALLGKDNPGRIPG
ncbi:GTP-binding protein HflX [Desulfofundulus australicus DSM 11792]|uniref:GTPase HflX n=1 Tax=Desulfofundulus australicus DSM 11792 TaxID=1121425 RepID=A0A1M4S7Q2_9FIRM|nr:GTPase HflX [Desulfofundulus australicus]SHE28236.1 GTP-binding protein HflX [Desulfofundulus australicus DSM 11792]